MLALRKTSAGYGIELTQAPPATVPASGEVTLEVEAVAAVYRTCMRTNGPATTRS